MKRSKFKDILKYYSEKDKRLLDSKGLIYHHNEFGVFAPSDISSVFELLKKLNFNKYDKFVDLGSGDGRVVLTASLFVDSVGIELDKKLYDFSKKSMKELSINNTQFVNKDFFSIKFKDSDLIYIAPDKNLFWNDDFFSRKGNLIVNSKVFLLSKKPKKIFNINNNFYYLYEF